MGSRRRCGSLAWIGVLMGVCVLSSVWLSFDHTARTTPSAPTKPGRTLGSLNGESSRSPPPPPPPPPAGAHGDTLASPARWHEVAGSRAFTPTRCPRTPEPGYPQEFAILNVTRNWNPDDPTIPPRHHAGLCRFDFQNEFDVALAYRKAEVPFLVCVGWSGVWGGGRGDLAAAN